MPQHETFTRDDVKYVLDTLAASTDELPEGKVLVTPIDQTVRLADGRFLQVVIMEGDQDVFDRTHG